MRAPTDKSETALLAQLAQIRDCRLARPGNADLAAMVKRVEGTDARSIRPAVEILHCLDGGDLEDLYRALGQCLSSSPNEFLGALRRERISDRQLNFMGTMLPLSLADDLDGQIAELEHRERAISGTVFANTRHSKKLLEAIAAARAELVEAKATHR